MLAVFLSLIDSEADKEKFTELYDTYKNLLYWIALQKTNSIEDSEECVQETFFYVAKHFEKIGDVKSKRTKAYLSAIVTGFAIDIYNNSEKAAAVSLDEDDSIELQYYEDFEKAELLSAFDGVLDEESKIYFYLKYLYNYKSGEIAEIYGVKDAYVRKKQQYAREKLRKHLEERKWESE